MPPDDETPAQIMNRVSYEIRGNAQPVLGGGYSGNVGASMGPLSGTVFSSSNDRVAGQPGVAGVSAGLGPLSAQFIKPTVRGVAPIVGGSIGGKPFDADTYFGVQAHKTPGGMQYGANVSRGGESGGAFLSGTYNPTRRDVNIMGGYERRFEQGGPVRMQEGGDFSPVLTITRRKPQNAPEGPRDSTTTGTAPVENLPAPEAYNRKFSETVREIPQGIIDYFANKAAQPDPSQRIAEDIKFLGSSLAGLPGAAVDYFAKKAEEPDPSQRVAEDITKLGAGAKQMFMENPVGTALDFMNLPGAVTSSREASELRQKYEEALAEGDTAKAASLKNQFGMAALGATPLVGGALKIAGKASKIGDAIRIGEKEIPIKASPDNLSEVMDAQTVAGRARPDAVMSIDDLKGGVDLNDKRQRARVDVLKENIMGDDGYISRIIVDQNGNVVEGQHRLEALRELGATEVPVSQFEDLAANVDMSRLSESITAAQKMPGDNKTQLVNEVLDALRAEGGDVKRVREDYTPPKGFESGWNAALDNIEAQLGQNNAPANFLSIEPVTVAFNDVPAPQAMRSNIIGEITASIDSTGGSAAKLPTTMGLGPMYVVDSGVQPQAKGFLLNDTKNRNAARQIAGITPLLEKYPDMALDPEQWVRGMSEATGSQNVVAPPYRFMKGIQPGGEYETLIRNMTPGQVAERMQGIAAGKEFLKAFTTGKMNVEDTGKLFMWGMLSRGVNPYTHEGLFMDAFKGIEPWIKMAAEGKFTPEVAAGPYKQWASSTAQKGSGQPGAGAMHNLNAFGEDFLVKMGTPGADGVTPLQKLHDLMTDPNLSGRDIRRAFAQTGEGVGIDNKVVSFIMLATGRDDVMVIDRIQLKNLWDDGRFEDFNIWDGISVPTVTTKDGKTTRFPPTDEGRAQAKAFRDANPESEGGNAAVTGSSLAEATYGAKGILVYEAIEDALMKHVQQLYDRVGRAEGQTITPGVFHWDSWVARSNQEASHGTLPAILKQAQGEAEPLAGIYSKQGDYQTYAYGAKYFRGPEGPYFTMPLSDGSEVRLTVAEMRRLQDELGDPVKGAVPVPTPYVKDPTTGEVREFPNTPAGRKEANAYAAELTATAREEARAADPSLDPKQVSAIKVPVRDREFSVSAVEGRPWYEDQSINRERVDKLIRDAGQRSGDAGAVAQAAVPNVAGRAIAEARNAAGFKSGLPRSYGPVDRGILERTLSQNPPAFDAPVANIYQPNKASAVIYNKAGKSTPPVYELKSGEQSAQAFYDAINDSKQGSNFGAAVHLYDPKEYEAMRLFLTPDGTAGFALKGDDIVSVFNNPKGPHKGVSNPLLDLAISQGGRKLDAYDTVLPRIYSQSGFKTTSRMSFNPDYAPGDWNYGTFDEFNKGKPDIVHMVYDPRHEGAYGLSDGRFFKDYDDAVNHQNKEVGATNNYLDKLRRQVAREEKEAAAKKAAKAAAKAAKATEPEKFAEGGAVEKKADIGDLIYDVAHLAARKDISKRHMTMLVRLATGADPEWSANVAGHLIGGDGTKLRLHAERHPKIIKAVARINEMLGGSKWKSVTDEHPLDGARVDHDMLKEVMTSGMAKDHSEMKKALRKLMEGSTHG